MDKDEPQHQISPSPWEKALHKVEEENEDNLWKGPKQDIEGDDRKEILVKKEVFCNLNSDRHSCAFCHF